MAKADVSSRLYQLTYLLPASMTETEVAAHKEAITGLVAKHKGEITKNEDWGKKKMAYKIRHSGQWHTEAYYVHFTLSFPASQVTAFEKDIYLQPQIMRHLLVIAEGDTEESAA